MSDLDTAGPAPAPRTAELLLGAGGLILLIGGPLHPAGTGDTVDAQLASMFTAPLWDLSHLLVLLGLGVAAAGFLVARRAGLFGATARPPLTVAAVGWLFGAAEMVPHLLASREHDALVAGGATPILDVHTALAVVASPAVGITGALLALAVARAEGTLVAWIAGTVGIVGGILYALAAPLVILGDDVRFSVLFAAQAGLAIWLVVTAVRRLAARARTSTPAATPVAH